MNFNNFFHLPANFFHGGIVFVFLLFLFIFMALIVISIIANWMLFKKAGKGGWESIIPFYNSYVLVEISGLNWWWVFLILAPSIVAFVNDDMSGIASLASLFAYFNCYYNIAKKFRKDTTTSVLSGIFNFIFILIFAFSKKEKYYKTEKVSPNGVFSSNNINNIVKKEDTIQDTLNYCPHCGKKMEDYYKFCVNCGKEKK